MEYLDNVLRSVFGDELRTEMDTLKSAIHDHKSDINVTAMSEASKMLNDLSLMSRTHDSDHELALREGFEYVVKGGHLELLMREVFVKYFAWCKRTGISPYYTSSEMFMSAMGKSPYVVDKLCMGSPLKTSGQARVYRFSLEKLTAEGVEAFKSKA